MSNKDVRTNTRPIFTGAIPGSPADLAGMKIGDVILSVNGIATTNFSEYVAERLKCNGSIKMDILRNNQLIEITLNFEKKKEENIDYQAIVKQLQDIKLISDSSQDTISSTTKQTKGNN